ncbi:hypothetical protein LCGC14_1704800 [marine sediment metagenome]|uniref:DUF6602 domain-containing protein n=1 Tax=marine sediment metagenome TaxID=412755 RepID=A0A0F9KH14_9ZZZZ|nr:hypothetical protein [bacterium]
MEEKKRPLLFQYFNNTADILLAEYKRTVGQEASDNLGANREFLCNAFLLKVLPIKLTLASGEIWDSKGNKTGQLDTIISRNDAPKLTFGERDTFLAEGVFSVIEIKSNLTRQKLNEAGRQLQKVKSLNIASGAIISAGPVISRPLRFVFAYYGAKWETLMDEVKNQNWMDLFDLICILNTGVLIKKGLLVQFDSKDHNYILMNGKAAPLAILYFYLVMYSCSFLGRSLNISNYFEPFNQWNI